MFCVMTAMRVTHRVLSRMANVASPRSIAWRQMMIFMSWQRIAYQRRRDNNVTASYARNICFLISKPMAIRQTNNNMCWCRRDIRFHVSLPQNADPIRGWRSGPAPVRRRALRAWHYNGGMVSVYTISNKWWWLPFQWKIHDNWWHQ